jgi:molecular chaperone GrpE
MMSEHKEEILDPATDGQTPEIKGQEEELAEFEGKLENETAEELDKAQALQAEFNELKDKYMRLYSEFENFRRRTAKEKIDMAQMAGKDVITALLPVLDDFERANKSADNSSDLEAVKTGYLLISKKLNGILEGKGLKGFDSMGQEFDVELHEAISRMASPADDMKDKIIGEVERGYRLHDKIIRHAKVVIGE